MFDVGCPFFRGLQCPAPLRYACPRRVFWRFPRTVPSWHTICAILARFVGGGGCPGSPSHSPKTARRQGSHGAEGEQSRKISYCGIFVHLCPARYSAEQRSGNSLGFCVHLRRPCPSMLRGFVMVLEPLSFASGQKGLPPAQSANRTVLPPEARWSCRQERAKGPTIGSPAMMNLTNGKSD
jgi:hypothetical protein